MRAIRARICVEVNLLEEPLKGSPLNAEHKHPRRQEVVYEKPDFYCTKSHKQVHTKVVCRAASRMQDERQKNIIENGLMVMSRKLIRDGKREKDKSFN